VPPCPGSLRKCNEIFAVAARMTSAVGSLYGAEGSIVFQHNTAPDDLLFHLHVHVVPRFPTITL
jgi:histidine triad (HIT) family protein